jgi:hypothetical protein
VSRGIAELVVTGATGSVTYRVQEDDASLTEKTPGAQVGYSYTRVVTGTGVAAGSVTITWKTPSGESLGNISHPSTLASAGDSYSFTAAPPLGSGSVRAGTLEIDLRATSTSSTAGYDVSTDGRGTQTLATGLSATRDRHWQRANTTVALTIGRNATADNTPVLSYGDNVRIKTVTGAPLYGTTSVPVELRRADTNALLAAGAGSAVFSTGASESTPSLIASVNNAQPAARVSTTSALGTFATAPSSGVPSMVPTGVTVLQAPDLDPRITVVRLMQHNDNVFGTPPGSKDAGIQRLTSELSFLSSRLINARGEGVNSVSVTRHLYDAGQLVATPTAGVTSGTHTTATVGGEAGWLGTFLTWDESLPGGTWLVRHTSGTSGVAGLLDPVDTSHTLVAADPNLRMICAGGPASSGQDTRHFSPGEPLLVGMAVFNVTTAKTVLLDETGIVPAVALGRFNTTLGRAEYLSADGVTWAAVADTEVFYHTLAKSPGDPKAWTKVFTDTSGFSGADVFVIGRASVGGVPVSSFQKEVVVSGVNSHTAYTFDALAFLGLGGQR